MIVYDFCWSDDIQNSPVAVEKYHRTTSGNSESSIFVATNQHSAQGYLSKLGLVQV